MGPPCRAGCGGLLIAVSVLFGGIGFSGWCYGISGYALTYAFTATFVVHCVFMQHWHVIFRFFGIQPKRFAMQPQSMVSGNE